MQIPAHFEVVDGKLVRNKKAPKPHHQDHALLLLQNLYGLEDAGRTWYQYLHSGLLKMGFKQSQVDPCLFVRGSLMLLVYINNCLVFSPKDKDIKSFVNDLKKKFVITDKGDISSYLGIQIDKMI